MTGLKRHYDAERLPYQLVLRDETLAVLALVVPDAAAAREFQRARDLMNAGHLGVARLRQTNAALDQPSHLVTRAVFEAARADFRDRLSRLDLDALAAAGRQVSVYRYDPERDEPRHVDDHDPN